MGAIHGVAQQVAARWTGNAGASVSGWPDLRERTRRIGQTED